MITLDALELPPDLLWQDETEWSGSQAAIKRTLLGRAVVQAQAIPSDSGRPITLGCDSAWIARETVLELQAWTAQPGRQMLLRLHDGRSFPVIFRLWEPPVLQAPPLFPVADPSGQTKHVLNSLRLAVAP